MEGRQLLAVGVIDNQDVAFQESGKWIYEATAQTYDSEHQFALGPEDGNTATWKFTDLTPGVYQASAYWKKHANHANNASYEILDGQTVVESTSVNQQVWPSSDIVRGGIGFQYLGDRFTVSGSEATVRLSSLDANGSIAADAIHLSKVNDLGVSDQISREFAFHGDWKTSNHQAYDGSAWYAPAGIPSNTATWTFDDLLPGNYEIAAYWAADSGNTTSAKYEILDDGVVVATVYANQRESPSPDVAANGFEFENLGSFVSFTGSELTVRLSNNALDGIVLADAVHLTAVTEHVVERSYLEVCDTQSIARAIGRVGSGYLLYATEAYSRFGSAEPNEFVSIVYENNEWYYDDDATLQPFSPVASDLIVAVIDFDDHTISSLESADAQTGGLVNGIRTGYADGDLIFEVYHRLGDVDRGGFGVHGTYLLPHQSYSGTEPVYLSGTSPYNVVPSDRQSGHGYIMYSEESVFTRFHERPPQDGPDLHFVSVTLHGGQWYRQDDDLSLRPFLPRSTDILLAEFDYPSHAMTSLEGAPPNRLNGIRIGYAAGNLIYRSGDGHENPTDEGLGVFGSHFVPHDRYPLTGRVELPGNPTQYVAASGGRTGAGYVMYSEQDVYARFPALTSPEVGSRSHFLAVQLTYNNDTREHNWVFVENNIPVNFNLIASDLLVAHVDFDSNTIEPFQSTPGRTAPGRSGFDSGNLVFVSLSGLGNEQNDGIEIQGTFFTEAPIALQSKAPRPIAKTQVIDQNTPHIYSPEDFPVATQEGSAAVHVRITPVEGSGGELTHNGVVLTDPSIVSLNEIAAGKLVFTPLVSESDAHQELRYSALDSSGRWSESEATSLVKTPPTGGNSSVAALGHQTFVFGTNHFPYSGIPETEIQAVRIDSLPSRGDLTLFNNPVLRGQQILASDIGSGAFRYDAEPGLPDSESTTFEFSVGDADGFAMSSSQMTINVTVDPPLIELLLTVRDANDNELTEVNGETEVGVGINNSFFLEVAYLDKRGLDATGAYSLYTDIGLSHPGGLLPVMREVQHVVFDSDFLHATTGSLTIGIEGSPSIYVATLTRLIENGIRTELSNALQHFGYSSSEFDIAARSNSTGVETADFRFEIRYTDPSVGNTDMPDLTFTADFDNAADVSFTEYSPLLSDGVSLNDEALPFNLDTRSRTLLGNAKFYNQLNRGSFDSDTGFIDIGGTGRAWSGGVTNDRFNGDFLTPLDVFRVEVYLPQALQEPLVVDVDASHSDDSPTQLYEEYAPIAPRLVRAHRGMGLTLRTSGPSTEPPNFWHNDDWPVDVNSDHHLSPLDVLLVVSLIEAKGVSGSVDNAILDPQNNRLQYDVDNSGNVTPVDALMVVNALASHQTHSAASQISSHDRHFGLSHAEPRLAELVEPAPGVGDPAKHWDTIEDFSDPSEEVPSGLRAPTQGQINRIDRQFEELALRPQEAALQVERGDADPSLKLISHRQKDGSVNCIT